MKITRAIELQLGADLQHAIDLASVGSISNDEIQ